MNIITHCPKCGKPLGAGVSKCWTKGCDYTLPPDTRAAIPKDIKFSCPSCGQDIACDESYQSAEVQCPTCQSTITVPAAPAPPAAQPEPPQKRVHTRFAVERLVFVIFAVIVAVISFSSAAKKGNEGGLYLPWETGATAWNLLALIMGFLLAGYAVRTFIIVRPSFWWQRFTPEDGEASPPHFPEFSVQLLLREFLVAGGIVGVTFLLWFAYVTIVSKGEAWK